MSKPPINFDQLPNTALIRQSDLLDGIVPFKSATLWRRVKAGQFPQPIRLTASRITAWRVGVVRAWLVAQGGAAGAEAREQPSATLPAAWLDDAERHYPDRPKAIDVLAVLADPHFDGQWRGNLLAAAEAVAELIEAAEEADGLDGMPNTVRLRNAIARVKGGAA